MASVNQITNIIAAIKTIYAYYARDTDVQMLVNTWSVLLKDYQDEIVDKALYLCLQTCKTPPTPADLIEQIKNLQAADEPSDEELWDILTRALRKADGLMYRFRFNYVEANGKTQGQNAMEDLDRLWTRLPERLQMYVGSKGEFMRMAQNYGEDELKFEKNRFLKQMPTIQKRQEYRNIALESGGGMAAGYIGGKSQ